MFAIKNVFVLLLLFQAIEKQVTISIIPFNLWKWSWNNGDSLNYLKLTTKQLSIYSICNSSFSNDLVNQLFAINTWFLFRYFINSKSIHWSDNQLFKCFGIFEKMSWAMKWLQKYIGQFAFFFLLYNIPSSRLKKLDCIFTKIFWS